MQQISTTRLACAAMLRKSAVRLCGHRRAPRKAYAQPLIRSSHSRAHGAPRVTDFSRNALRGIVVGGGIVIAVTCFSNFQQAHAETPPLINADPGETKGRSTISLEGMPLIKYDISEMNITGAKEEFVALLGADRVIVDVAICIAHSSTEWSEAPRGELDRPAIVVHPRTTEDVSAIAKICHRRRMPMIGFCGGTSLEGTLAATQGGVCIDFKLMNKVVAVHSQDMDVVVQPGIGYTDLNEVLAREGFYFPPDPGPGAQIGGMISQGCSGTNAYRYGTMKDWVLGLTVVLADGTIVKTRRRPRKSSSGYNLTQLMVGSEGTLGLVTEASLKMTTKPENIRVAVAAFPSTHKAVETAVKIVQSDMSIAAMEMLDDVSMQAVNGGGYCERKYAEVPTLFLKFAGSQQVVQEQIARVQQLAKDSLCDTFEFSTTEEEAESIWSARKTVLWSTLAMKQDPSDDFLSADTAVPISRLADAVEEVKAKIRESGLIGSCLGHVGDGNFHTSILFPAKDRQKAQELITWVQRKAIEMEGTVTGEHGIGLQYRDMVVEELGSSSVDMMRQVKLALDPYCLLNPEKIFRLKIEG